MRLRPLHTRRTPMNLNYRAKTNKQTPFKRFALLQAFVYLPLFLFEILRLFCDSEERRIPSGFE